LAKKWRSFRRAYERSRDTLNGIALTGKLNGATGTLAAHQVAMPDVDWALFSKAFVRLLDLEPVLLTTEVEPARQAWPKCSMPCAGFVRF
jgi:adenylosuccinate lyase